MCVERTPAKSTFSPLFWVRSGMLPGCAQGEPARQSNPAFARLAPVRHGLKKDPHPGCSLLVFVTQIQKSDPLTLVFSIRLFPIAFPTVL